MSALATASHQDSRSTESRAQAARIEELGRIIQAYSQVTERLQESHTQLQATVQNLRNELQEKNQQLQRRQRLAALGEMAAGMAHEIRNPLGGIQLYASMLLKDLGDMPAPLALVSKISSGVKRLDSLVGQVLNFTREVQANPVTCDVAGLVDQAMDFAGDRISSEFRRGRTAGPRPFKVCVDPLLMGQAILNLLINAADAVGEKGEIEVEWGGGPSGEWYVTVADNGPGIPPEILDRIFNPFFTTKGNGTGLGLAIVHRIVEAHEGTITVSNRAGGGAVFEIRI